MDIILEQPYIQPLHKDWHRQQVASVSMLRLDVLHPVVSGNKWYKLKHNIQYALSEGYKQVLTFGGAYSNHLVAAAATAKAYGIGAVGIVKGQYAEKQLTPTLKECMDYGMQLHFATNEDYAKKGTADYLQLLSDRFNAPFIIPEGGANEWGREGAAEIAQLIPQEYSYICVSVGTGTTLVGIYNGTGSEQQVLGYVPMKHGSYMKEIVYAHLEGMDTSRLSLYDDWHFGGFGKHTAALVNFMNEFYRDNQVPLDMVYTAKMMYGVQEQINSGFFPAEANILCIHTGGLQGNVSLGGQLIY